MEMYVHIEEDGRKLKMVRIIARQTNIECMLMYSISKLILESECHHQIVKKNDATISEINVNSSNAADCILGPNVNEIPT